MFLNAIDRKITIGQVCHKGGKFFEICMRPGRGGYAVNSRDYSCDNCSFVIQAFHNTKHPVGKDRRNPDLALNALKEISLKARSESGKNKKLGSF